MFTHVSVPICDDTNAIYPLSEGDFGFLGCSVLLRRPEVARRFRAERPS